MAETARWIVLGTSYIGMLAILVVGPAYLWPQLRGGAELPGWLGVALFFFSFFIWLLMVSALGL